MNTDKLENLFLREHGVFSRNLQFNAVVIFIVVTGVFSYYFRDHTYAYVIILIVFALYIANTYVTVSTRSLGDINKRTMLELDTLQLKTYEYIDSLPYNIPKSELQKLYKRNVLESLYIDATMIHFLYSIIWMYQYSPGEFYLLLKGTNNILRIRREIDEFYKSEGVYPVNVSEMFEIALELRSKTINNMHNFVYNIPKTIPMFKYVDSVTERYIVLISRTTDHIHKCYLDNIRQRGVNTTTKFVTYNTTKPYDVLVNHPIKHNKDHDKLLDFYL
jgi:hypothetical protein